MSFPYRAVWVSLLMAVACGGAETNRVLRIAADPNNLPFTNAKLEGFENKIAEVIARDLHATIEYNWRAQRRGFFRETLKEDKADLVLGAPAEFDRALTTRPYYRSSYVFLYRKDRGLHISSFDDEQLRTLRVGVQLVGDDGANPPPAHALARRGIVTNVVGFMVYGDYREANPSAGIINAVVTNGIDVAIAWGPLAGYFAKQSRIPLEISLVAQADSPALPMAFDIACGVRRRDKALREELNNILEHRKTEIEKILDDYAVPRARIAHSMTVQGGSK